MAKPVLSVAQANACHLFRHFHLLCFDANCSPAHPIIFVWVFWRNCQAGQFQVGYVCSVSYLTVYFVLPQRVRLWYDYCCCWLSCLLIGVIWLESVSIFFSELFWGRTLAVLTTWSAGVPGSVWLTCFGPEEVVWPYHRHAHEAASGAKLSRLKVNKWRAWQHILTNTSTSRCD